jgi:hypothetical protein
VLLVAGLMGAAFGRRTGVRPVWRLRAFATLIPVAVLAGDFLQRLHSALSPAGGLLLIAVVLTVVVIGCAWLGGALARSRITGARVPMPVKAWGILLFLNATAAAVSAQRFSEAVDPTLGIADELGGNLETEWEKLPAADVQAVTDRGRPVALFVPPPDYRETGMPTQVSDRMRHRIIEVAASDVTANCHGWVFTGGKYLMAGCDVELILEDNDYVAHEQPQPNDIVIYRDDIGQIMHTGLVKLVEDDLVLIESKWGVQGRFLHRPEDPGFTPHYTYYRTSRGNHRLKIYDLLAGQIDGAAVTSLPTKPGPDSAF